MKTCDGPISKSNEGYLKSKMEGKKRPFTFCILSTVHILGYITVELWADRLRADSSMIIGFSNAVVSQIFCYTYTPIPHIYTRPRHHLKRTFITLAVSCWSNEMFLFILFILLKYFKMKGVTVRSCLRVCSHCRWLCGCFFLIILFFRFHDYKVSNKQN